MNETEANASIGNENVMLTKNVKPFYGMDESLQCGTIVYNGKTYLLDMTDRDKIINLRKPFIFQTNEDIYPSFLSSFRRITYLEFLYPICKENKVCYEFKNKNQFDLRKSNVQIFHFYHETMRRDFDNIVDYIPGHYLTIGHDANIMKNPIWVVIENGKEYMYMYCEANTRVKICRESYKIICNFNKQYSRPLTWHKCTNGYVQAHIPSQNNLIYIHQVIANCYGNGKGTKTISVDHIDQNPLNNSLENLRIATREEQEQNCNGIKEGTKRQRKTSAKPLPDGITQEKMKKYVVYYQEWLDKEHTKQREYFKVEKHPKLNGKPWIGTKSGKVSIIEKLAEANKVVENLENDIFPNNNSNNNNNSCTLSNLPTYITITKAGEKTYLVYDEKDNDGLKQKRKNLKMVLPSNYDLQEQLMTFREKINAKYND